MKRLSFLLLILLLPLVHLVSFSVMDERIQEQPFDSEQELAKRDFSKTLAENQRTWAEDATISLLTVGPGDPLYAWFGHSALIVTQPLGNQVMYDWGIFDPNQKHFYLNFARGRMYYSVYESEAGWRIRDVISEDRDVQLLDLNLTPEAKFTMIQFMQNNAKAENSTYLYHFYDDNCATRIRDILNAATGGEFRTWAENEEAGGSFRSFIQRNMIHSPVIFWALDFLQSGRIDAPLNRYEEMFLPESLHQAVLDFTYADGTPLARRNTVLHDTSNTGVRFVAHTKNVNYDWAYALAGICLGLIGYLLANNHKRLWGLYYGMLSLILGVLGTLLLFMMTLSDMDMTYFNENIVFINPMLFAGAVSCFAMVFSKKRRGNLAVSLFRIFSVVICILIVAKGVFPSVLNQDNLRILLLILPVFFSGAAFQGRGYRKQL